VGRKVNWVYSGQLTDLGQEASQKPISGPQSNKKKKALRGMGLYARKSRYDEKGRFDRRNHPDPGTGGNANYEDVEQTHKWTGYCKEEKITFNE